MPGLGVVLGSGARELELPEGALALNRHGDEGYALPHVLDHVANMRRLRDAGCDRVLGIGSVGSLRADLPPGSFVCPHDFIALDATPLTTLEGFAAHRVPGFDEVWRERVLAALRDAAEPHERGVYWQVRGPRLETQAEVRFVAAHADVIGMTIGSECVAAGELGLAYAALCVVDNFANGIAEQLTLAEIAEGQVRHREALAGALARAIPMLA